MSFLPVFSKPMAMGLIVFAAPLVLLSACGPGTAPNGDSGRHNRARSGDDVAARVNGTTIYASDVEREAAAQNIIQVGEPLLKGSKQYRQVLDDLIDQRLMALEAVRKGLDRNPEASRRLQAARERILGDILLEDTVSKAVTDKAVRRMYDEQSRLAPPGDEVRARHILVQTKEEAQDIIKTLKAGGDFAKLALEKSLDPGSRLEGGDLGYFTKDSMVEPFAKAAFSLKVGQISAPVKSEFGWHVIKVEGRRKQKLQSFDEMRARIVRFMTFDQIQKLITKLRKNAIIERDEDEKPVTVAPVSEDKASKTPIDPASKDEAPAAQKP